MKIRIFAFFLITILWCTSIITYSQSPATIEEALQNISESTEFIVNSIVNDKVSVTDFNLYKQQVANSLNVLNSSKVSNSDFLFYQQDMDATLLNINNQITQLNNSVVVLSASIVSLNNFQQAMYDSLIAIRDLINGSPPQELKWSCSGAPNYTCIQSTTGIYNTQAECISNCIPPVTIYQVTIQTGSNGTTIPTTGLYNYNSGTSVTITANPNTNYKFDYWTVNGTINTTNPFITTINSNLIVSPTFSVISPPIVGDFYYVGKTSAGLNNGKKWEDRWATINWSVIQPGAVIFFDGGIDSVVYSSSQFVTVGKNGTSKNPITLTVGKYSPNNVGHSGRVIFDGGGGGGTAFQVRATGVGRKYIKLKGFECRNLGKGVNIEDVSSNIVVEDFYIYNYSGQGAIMLNGASSYTIDSTQIINNRIISVKLAASQSDGIYAQRCQRTLLVGNYIHQRNQDPSAHTDGLQAYLTNGWVIYNNFFINDSVYSPQGGGTPMIFGIEGNNRTIVAFNFLYMGGIWDPSGNLNCAYWSRYYDNVMSPNWFLQNTVLVNGPRCRGAMEEYNTTMVNNIIASFSTTSQLASLEESLPTYIPVDSTRGNLFYRSSGGVGLAGAFRGNNTTINGPSWTQWTTTLGGTGLNINPLLVQKIGYLPNQGLVNGELQVNSPAKNAGTNTIPLIIWLRKMGFDGTGLHPHTGIWEIQLKGINGGVLDSTPTIGAYQY